jgi:hypothetical protein
MSHRKSLIIISTLTLLLANIAQGAVSNWQKGASFAPRTTTEFSSDLFKQSVRNLKSTGADYATLVIPYYQASLSATTMGPGKDTPTDQSLIDAITYVHSQGMKVNLKPHLQITGSTAWRATISPTDRAAWYASYEKMLQHYAAIAQTNHVEQITIGTELINMASSYVSSSNPVAWRGIIDRLRPVYSGLLTYSANWGAGDWYDEKKDINFWDKLDSIGISAYFYMTPSTTYTMQQLHDKWDSYNTTQIKPLSDKWGKPVIFTEVGYRSIDGALVRPPQWENTGTFDEQEQADAYEALFSYWNDQAFMQGVQWWEWRSDPNAGGAGDNSFTPQNKLAEQVMAKWFGGTPAQTQAFSTSSLVSTANPVSGLPVNFSTLIKNLGSPQNVAVDIEIYKNTGEKVFQKTFDNESFANIESKTYQLSWTPALSGTYNIKIGLFSTDWSNLKYWNDNSAKITVGQGSTTPPPAPTPTPVPPPSPTPTPPPLDCNSTGTNNFYGCYYDNQDFTNLKLTRTDNIVNFDWGGGSPDPILGADTFSARWQGNFTFNAASYDFSVTADDGVRLYIDNALVIDKWIDQGPTTYTASRQMTQGSHTIKIEYYENGGGAVAKASWAQAQNPTPLPPPSPNPTPTPLPPANANIDVWWPSNGATISGVQPFQAIINGLPINSYQMYWQVDGGSLNLMNTDSSNGYDHKQSWVDVSGWWWRNNGPYTINFVARDLNGNLITQKSVSIYVAH